MEEHPPPESPARRLAPSEFRPYPGRLSLVCAACSRKKPYRVGTLYADPLVLEGGEFDDAVGFSAIFHCERCGSPGPWRLPPETAARINELLAEANRDPKTDRIHLAQMRLFDGTVVRTGAEGAAILKRKIEASPGNAELWVRLGRLYGQAGEHDLAIDACDHALSLDPHQAEANYVLGCVHMDARKCRDPEQAVARLRWSLCDAGRTPGPVPDSQRPLLRDALERLRALATEEAEDCVWELPTPNPGDTRKAGEPIYLQAAACSDETIDALVEMWVTGEVPPNLPYAESAESLDLLRRAWGSMVPFHVLFPEIHEKETRTIHLPNDPALGNEEYALLEVYCVQPDCDCRRLLFNVVRIRDSKHVATINYAFDRGARDAGPFLDPLNPQSESSKPLLGIVAALLEHDPAYVTRLERHYRLVKKAVADPSHPVHAVIGPMKTPPPPGEGEIVSLLEEIGGDWKKESPKMKPIRREGKTPGRNDPCPCGSGRKYKRCCDRGG